MAAMNAAIVGITVACEEHPAVDEISGDAAQALSDNGGGPLNAFTDHQVRPFYALTDLPRDLWGQLSAELARLFRDGWATAHPDE